MNGIVENQADVAFLHRIGERITAIRRHSKTKQKDFAESIGLTQGALSKYEAGRVNIPVLSLKAISDKYDVEITDFFISSERPSTLFKRMLKVPATPHKDDKVFDEYISKPENADKKALLYHMSQISNMDILISNKELQQQLIIEVESSIIQDTNVRQRARLLEYVNALQQISYKSDEQKNKNLSLSGISKYNR